MRLKKKKIKKNKIKTAQPAGFDPVTLSLRPFGICGSCNSKFDLIPIFWHMAVAPKGNPLGATMAMVRLHSGADPCPSALPARIQLKGEV